MALLKAAFLKARRSGTATDFASVVGRVRTSGGDPAGVRQHGSVRMSIASVSRASTQLRLQGGSVRPSVSHGRSSWGGALAALAAKPGSQTQGNGVKATGGEQQMEKSGLLAGGGETAAENGGTLAAKAAVHKAAAAFGKGRVPGPPTVHASLMLGRAGDGGGGGGGTGTRGDSLTAMTAARRFAKGAEAARAARDSQAALSLRAPSRASPADASTAGHRPLSRGASSVRGSLSRSGSKRGASAVATPGPPRASASLSLSRGGAPRRISTLSLGGVDVPPAESSRLSVSSNPGSRVLLADASMRATSSRGLKSVNSSVAPRKRPVKESSFQSVTEDGDAPLLDATDHDPAGANGGEANLSGVVVPAPPRRAKSLQVGSLAAQVDSRRGGPSGRLSPATGVAGVGGAGGESAGKQAWRKVNYTAVPDPVQQEASINAVVLLAKQRASQSAHGALPSLAEGSLRGDPAPPQAASARGWGAVRLSLPEPPPPEPRISMFGALAVGAPRSFGTTSGGMSSGHASIGTSWLKVAVAARAAKEAQDEVTQDEIVGSALIFAFIQSAHLRPLARVAQRQRLAAIRFGDTRVWGHSFPELVDSFTMLVGSSNMPVSGDWIARARLWHIYFLAVRLSS